MSAYFETIFLLVCSNAFMTIAWYAHIADEPLRQAAQLFGTKMEDLTLKDA
ncbi:MAG TPA: DMT family protein [Alphaproteobacteria bacterium]|nr:DMT family protein [Alphaproteobacteria bacterium]